MDKNQQDFAEKRLQEYGISLESARQLICYICVADRIEHCFTYNEKLLQKVRGTTLGEMLVNATQKSFIGVLAGRASELLPSPNKADYVILHKIVAMADPLLQLKATSSDCEDTMREIIELLNKQNAMLQRLSALVDETELLKKN